MAVLIRITDAYTAPKFNFILDPWLHFSSGILQARSGYVLPASFRLTQHQIHREPIAYPDSLVDKESNVADTGTISSATTLFRDRTKIHSQIPKKSQNPESKSSRKQIATQLTARSSPSTEVSSTAMDLKRKRSPERSPNTSEMYPPSKKIASRLDVLSSYNYKYTDLHEHEIRLFTLFPGNAIEKIQGVLWTTSITNAGAYTTLSYVWGPKDQTMHVLRTPSGDLVIRESLYAALLSLRPKREPMTLWIDALCINQKDKREKSSQITLLAEIFQRSVSTLAFIGKDEDHSEAIQMLNQVRVRMVLGSASEKWPEDLPRCPASWEQRGMPYPEDEIWTNVAIFFKNQWFRRAWIVQEAVVARKLSLVLGKMRIDWNHLFLVINHIDKELESTERSESASWVPFLKLAKLRHMEDRSGRASILKLLENFRHAKSSDPRDKYFSLLGIASDGNLEEFEPDYSSSLTEITLRFATALLRRFSEKNQAMLLLYRAGLSQTHDLPSWVPDWLEEKANGLHDALARGNAFNACGDLAEQIEYVPHTGELRVKAYLVDEVEYVTQSCNGAEKSEQRRYFAEIKHFVEEVFGDVWDDEQIQRVLWEAPVAGAKHPKFAQPGYLSIYDSWEAFMELLNIECLNQEDEMKTPQHQHDLETKSRAYQCLLADEIRNWRFVILKERNLCGIAPNIVQEGDVVHLFHGGVVPFITRRSEERDGAYKLVGQCYIWGMMQGEGTDYDELIQETVRLH